jgi:MFS family permease
VRKPAIFRPLGGREFRALWLSQCLSAVGDGIFPVGLIALLLQNEARAGIGLVLAAESAGAVLTGLVGGVIGDRFRRSRVMAVGDVLRLAATGALALGGGSLPLPVLAFLASFMGIGSALFTPACGALIPTIVPADQLTEANALRSASLRVAAIGGAAAGGVALAVSGPATLFWLDFATFVVSVAVLLSFRERPPRRGNVRIRVWHDAREGLTTVLAHPWIATVIAQGAVHVVLVIAPVVVLLPLVLADRGMFFSYGTMLALQGIGAVVGGLVAGWWKPRRAGLVAIAGLALFSGPLLWMAANPPLYVLGAAMIASGFGYTLFGVLWTTALQRAIPEDLRARVFALDMLGTWSLEPVGLALAPIAAMTFGIVPLVTFSLAMLAIMTVLPLLVPGVIPFADDPPAPEPAETDRARTR